MFHLLGKAYLKELKKKPPFHRSMFTNINREVQIDIIIILHGDPGWHGG